MITIRFGRWNYHKASWFTYKRIYFKGYKWTPFVKVGVLAWGDNKNRTEYVRR